MFIRFFSLCSILSTFLLTLSAYAQTDSSAPAPSGVPAAPGKPPSFKSIEAGYFYSAGLSDPTGTGAGYSAHFEIPGPVSSQRIKLGAEHRRDVITSTMVFGDYVWYDRGPHMRKFFNSYYEAGLGIGASGTGVQYASLEFRSAYGIRMRFSDRIYSKLALHLRFGLPNIGHFDLSENKPYPNLSLDLSLGYDLF
jgi:hypothetical protein